MDENNRQKIRDSVRESFIERNENTIQEKISYCIDQGLSEDKARHVVIQVIKNLSEALLPLDKKISVQNNEWS